MHLSITKLTRQCILSVTTATVHIMLSLKGQNHPLWQNQSQRCASLSLNLCTFYAVPGRPAISPKKFSSSCCMGKNWDCDWLQLMLAAKTSSGHPQFGWRALRVVTGVFAHRGAFGMTFKLRRRTNLI
eukprot:6201687-Pleurochrysis_carterae.AAC.4